MGEEYNQRISNIANGIVEFEKKFNKKKIDENSVIASIKSITKKYNVIGQDLILESLERKAELSPSEILNSTGEISETVLTEAISYVINTASSKGIDIITPQQTNIEKNNVTVIAEGVLTVAIIDTMIKNYDNLSVKDRINLSKNINNMSESQVSEFGKKLKDNFLNSISENIPKKDQHNFKAYAERIFNLSEACTRYIELKNKSNITLDEIRELELIEKEYGFQNIEDAEKLRTEILKRASNINIIMQYIKELDKCEKEGKPVPEEIREICIKEGICDQTGTIFPVWRAKLTNTVTQENIKNDKESTEEAMKRRRIT